MEMRETGMPAYEEKVLSFMRKTLLLGERMRKGEQAGRQHLFI